MTIKEIAMKSRTKGVEDEFIGILFKKDNKINFRYRRNFEELFIPAKEYNRYTKNTKYSGVIAWIIESPHKHEFLIDIPKYPSGRSRGRPLNNPKTQSYVKPMFEEILGDFLEDKVNEGEFYLVLLINSSKFQCSLGERTDIYRDKAFIYNWLKDERGEFLEKIQNYGPDIYINSCTKGNISFGYLEKHFNLIQKSDGNIKIKGASGIGLNGMIEGELLYHKLINKHNYIRCTHPSYYVYQESLAKNVTYKEPEAMTDEALYTLGEKQEKIQLKII